MERPGSRSETVCGLSKLETSALFHRACQVFMQRKNDTSFNSSIRSFQDLIKVWILRAHKASSKATRLFLTK